MPPNGIIKDEGKINTAGAIRADIIVDDQNSYSFKTSSTLSLLIVVILAKNYEIKEAAIPIEVTRRGK